MIVFWGENVEYEPKFFDVTQITKYESYEGKLSGMFFVPAETQWLHLTTEKCNGNFQLTYT